MTEGSADTAEPDVMELFDRPAEDAGGADGASVARGALACRVCGALVAATGPYPRAHWDWHETPNGA